MAFAQVVEMSIANDSPSQELVTQMIFFNEDTCHNPSHSTNPPVCASEKVISVYYTSLLCQKYHFLPTIPTENIHQYRYRGLRVSKDLKHIGRERKGLALGVSAQAL